MSTNADDPLKQVQDTLKELGQADEKKALDKADLATKVDDVWSIFWQITREDIEVD